MSEAIQRKLAAIFSADLAGYSRLMGSDETGTFATLGELRRIADSVIEHRSGRIANTAGDSVLAEFPSVVEAVHCAIEIQQALAAWNADQPTEGRMQLRIGLHVGDVMVKDEDIFGDGVNVASRLQALAAPGAILASRAVRDHVRDRSPLFFDDMGEQPDKNIARPVRVFRVRFDGEPTTPQEVSRIAVPSDVSPDGKEADPTELAFWDAVKESKEPADYTAYIDSYPEGNFAALALSRIASLSDSAQMTAPEAKEADATEFAFWDTVKDSKETADYEAYMARYPNGIFADLALTRFDSLRNAPPPASANDVKLELTYWESVKESGDNSLIRAYLENYPAGHFRELAEAMLKGLK